MLALVLAICSILVIVSLVLSNGIKTQEDTLTPLESGFEILSPPVFLSSSFFLLAIIFVLFDLEMVLLIPGILFHLFEIFLFRLMWLALLVVIIITLIFEWKLRGLR